MNNNCSDQSSEDSIKLIDFTSGAKSKVISSRKVFILSPQSKKEIPKEYVYSDNSDFTVMYFGNPGRIHVYFTGDKTFEEFPVKGGEIAQITTHTFPSIIAISYTTPQIDYMMFEMSTKRMHLLASYNSARRSPLQCAFATECPSGCVRTAILEDNKVLVFDLNCSKTRFRLLTESDSSSLLTTTGMNFKSISFAPQSIELFASDSIGTVHVVEKSKEYSWIPHERSPVDALEFVGVWGLITVCTPNTEIKLWNRSTWGCLNTMRFQYLPDGFAEFDDSSTNLKVVVCSDEVVLVRDSYNHIFVFKVRPGKSHGAIHVTYFPSAAKNLLSTATRIIKDGTIQFLPFPSNLIRDEEFTFSVSEVTTVEFETDPPVKKPTQKVIKAESLPRVDDALKLETSVVETRLGQLTKHEEEPMERHITLVANEDHETVMDQTQFCRHTEHVLQLTPQPTVESPNNVLSPNYESSNEGQYVPPETSEPEFSKSDKTPVTNDSSQSSRAMEEIKLIKEEVISLRELVASLRTNNEELMTNMKEEVTSQISVGLGSIQTELSGGFDSLRSDVHCLVKTDLQTVREELPKTVDYEKITNIIFDKMKTWIEVNMLAVVESAMSHTMPALSNSVLSRVGSQIDDKFEQFYAKQKQNLHDLKSFVRELVSGAPDTRANIGILLENKEFSKAFDLALTSQDCDLVRSLCQNIDDFGSVFDDGGFSQAHYLSIISCLSVKTEDWEDCDVNCLFECVSRLNLDDQSIVSHAHSVLTPLQQTLEKHKPLRNNLVKQFSQFLNNFVRVLKIK